LLPGIAADGFKATWRSTIVAPGDVTWGSSGSRPFTEPTYDQYLDQLIEADDALSNLRIEFYAALAIADIKRAGASWTRL